LTPSESKRLIAKGVVEYLKDSIDECTILVTRGSTNAYVLEELLKYLEADASFNKADFITGEILAEGNSRLWANKRRKSEVVIEKREVRDVEDDADRLKIVQGMKSGDVVIKGANAIDHTGMAGILVGYTGGQVTGGTIGSLYGVIKAKGLDLVCPVGLGKMVMGEITETSNIAGGNFCKFSQGMPVGLFPVAANVITEIEALEMLFDCEVFHLAAGGIGTAQGSVVLLIEAAEDEELEKIGAFLDENVFGELALEPNTIE
jgi:hypothetical protein